jgi:hypothetical protein
MSWQKHQTKSFRKLITYEEMADYTGVTRNTVINNLNKYKLEHDYDPRDIYSVFDFFLYLLMVNIGIKDNNKVPPYIFLVSVFKGLLKERKKLQA